MNPNDLARLIATREIGHRTLARALAGPDAPKKAIDVKRRQLLKWLAELESVGITTASSNALAMALGCDAEEFLEPLPTPEELRIREAERLEARAEALRRGQEPPETPAQERGPRRPGG